MIDDRDLARACDAGSAEDWAIERLNATEQTAKGLDEMEIELGRVIRALSALPGGSDSPGSAILTSAAKALGYRIEFEGGRTRFVPHMIFPGDQSDPVEIVEQSPETVATWSDLFASASGPALRGRLGHLLVEGRLVAGRELPVVAEAALLAYLNVPVEFGMCFDSIECFRCALDLAKSFGFLEGAMASRAALLAHAGAALEQDDRPKPGIVFRALEPLVVEDEVRDEVSTLLDAAADSFRTNIHQLDHVYELRLQLARSESELKSQLWRDRVNAWFDAVADAPGPQRTILLHSAAELANASGDRDLRLEAVARLQEVRLSDLELMGISAEIVRRRTEMLSTVEPILCAASWSEALDVFATWGPPTGSYERNQEAVAEDAQQFVLSHLLPPVRVGGDGLIRFSAEGEDGRREFALVQREMLNLQFNGVSIVEALLRFPEHFELPSTDQLAAHFGRADSVVSSQEAYSIARSYQRWWCGDYEAAGMTALPRVEGLARQLLLAVNAGIYRLQREETPGQYPGLGFLLSRLLDHGLDRSWQRYIHSTLSNVTGLNLRNEAVHGFVESLDIATSAYILHMCSFLAYLPIAAGREA